MRMNYGRLDIDGSVFPAQVIHHPSRSFGCLALSSPFSLSPGREIDLLVMTPLSRSNGSRHPSLDSTLDDRSMPPWEVTEARGRPSTWSTQ